MMFMEITEYWTGKRHYRTLHCGSCSYQVEGRYLVVRDYYSNKIVHKFNVSKYGSIRFTVVDRKRY